MKKYDSKWGVCILSVVALGAIASLGPAASRGQEPAEEPNSWAKYEIILKRNIFSRQRGPEQTRTRRDDQPLAVPNPESYYRLEGVVQEDGTFIAFVEDMRSGSVLRLRQGQNVARGVVKSLTLDSMEYEYEGRTVAVELGRDLEGGLGAVTRTELLEWSSSQTSQPATSSEPATEADPDILKQLMERRQQELGR